MTLKQPDMKTLSNFLRLAVLVIVIGIAIPGHAATNYYSNSTGDLSQTSSWGTNTNGTGTAPTSFTANNQVFNIVNNATPTIGANWTVSGTGSYILVGNGTNACNFQIPSNHTCTATINVSANATLTIANTTNPTLGTLNASSTVVFDGTAGQTIPAVTYGNLTYSGSNTGTMAGGCTISGTLSATGNGILELDNSNSSYTYTVGSMVVTTTQYLDFGSTNTGGPNAAVMNLSGNLSGTGEITTAGQENNGTINFTGTNQTIQAANILYVDLVVASGSVVTLGGNFSYCGATPGYVGSFTVESGATLNCGTYEMNTAPVVPPGGYTAMSSFILNSGATLITANTAGISSSGTSGSIQTTAQTYSSGANYTYDGSAAQITGVFTTTPTAKTVNNLTINNTSTSGVTLSQAEAVAGVLTLTDGLLTTTSTNLITVNNGGSTTGASNGSFVNGPIAKIGKQAFTFPVGVSGTGYVPIGISAPSATTDVFWAQYNRSSGAALGPITASGLDHVSSCDYWTLNHTTGTDAVSVTAYWNANNPCGSSYITILPALALAHFNGTSWNLFGGTVVLGSTIASGSITWTGVSNFSPFALSSTTVANPLPITLVDFTAQWQTGGTVGLTWEVQEGADINHFDIQRSADGVNWQTIGTLDASGSSAMATDYSYTDGEPLPGQDYYRLQLVDDNGNDTYSTVKVVSQSSGNGIIIFPNPATDHINVSFGVGGVSGSAGVSGALGSPGTGGMQGPVSIRLMNVTGQLLLQESVISPAGQTITLPVAGYPAGSYLVQVIAGEVKKSGIVLIIK
jgi:Secretion system C-terminal sorting domain